MKPFQRSSNFWSDVTIIAYALLLALSQAMDQNANASLTELAPIVLIKLSNIIYHLSKKDETPHNNEQENIHNIDTPENVDGTI
jgi:hypothetical protein